MKTLVKTIVTIVAGTLALGSMAYGQTTLKADIPFAFHASGSTLPGGSYMLVQDYRGGSQTMHLWNATTRRGTVIASYAADHYKTGPAEIVFLCRQQQCSLSAIRTPSGTIAWPAPRHMERDAQTASVVSFPLMTAAGH